MTDAPQDPDSTSDSRAGDPPDLFRLKSGTDVHAGWLARDLPFLIRSLRFLMRNGSDALRTGLDLEPGSIGVLGLVAGNPGISQNDLAASLVLKKSAVTKIVQHLEQDGLIARRRSAEDRRANRVYLSLSGKRIEAELRRRAGAMNEVWLEGIPAAEREVLLSALSRLVRTLSERGAAGDGEGERPRAD